MIYALLRRLYDVGDKAGRLLAWLDKRDQERSWVRTIRNKEGTDCESSESKVEVFAVYYEDVYTSASWMTEEDCTDLLRDIKLPSLSESERQDLEADLMEDEVADAMRGLQSGKAEGPNGLPAELFKCLGSIVTRHMLAMFEEAREVGRLPLDQRMAMVVVLVGTRNAIYRVVITHLVDVADKMACNAGDVDGSVVTVPKRWRMHCIRV
ncbi:hypothetical protein NDU88_005980 [Pleurodeles waltl]|uniref:BH3-interacting domain death agonist n=1 Tax=Pleurodeles waltl TaxID=8319 RepID=A0AAV7VQ47_PLEWA|nr:hypothetical protein NDU88_005980 [Pleurodeles waltl]